MRPSQNLPLPPRLYPLFKQLYSTLPESTPPSQNILPFSTTIILCDRPRIYPSLPENTPRFNNYNIMRPFRNLPLPPRIYLLFNKYNIMRPSQNVPLPPKIYPLFQQLYTTFPEYTPFSQNTRLFQQLEYYAARIYPSLPEYTSRSITICDTPRIYHFPPPPPSLSEYIPPPFSTTISDIPRIYPSVTEYVPFPRNYMYM